jgi:hypothetical protein
MEANPKVLERIGNGTRMTLDTADGGTLVLDFDRDAWNRVRLAIAELDCVSEGLDTEIRYGHTITRYEVPVGMVCQCVGHDGRLWEEYLIIEGRQFHTGRYV